ncbi:MAG TPA: DUF2071 domain-containing protein [Phototrophicaceae bacterium]|nr:DUF2071 domain-containing protein [Phototrophicaceae bacterium]
MFPSASSLLAATAHRPWPTPKRHWVLAQSWEQLLFAHWRVDPKLVAPLIPAGLQLDTFDGSAWIGIVPFRMDNVHPRGTFNVEGLSRFPELNVRTYVTRDGKPGVWFLSLDAGNPVAVRIARRLFHLPYYNAEMDIYTENGWVQYRSQRKDGQADFEACYRSTSPVFRSERGSLDEWLTERYCLYSADLQDRIYRCEIHHQAWPLQRAEGQISMNTMVHGFDLPDEPPILHYADRLDVLTWYLERVK